MLFQRNQICFRMISVLHKAHAKLRGQRLFTPLQSFCSDASVVQAGNNKVVFATQSSTRCIEARCQGLNAMYKSETEPKDEQCTERLAVRHKAVVRHTRLTDKCHICMLSDNH